MIEFAKFTEQSGVEIWINPAHVVLISTYEDGLTTIHLATGKNHYVDLPPAEVIRQLKDAD